MQTSHAVAISELAKDGEDTIFELANTTCLGMSVRETVSDLLAALEESLS